MADESEDAAPALPPADEPTLVGESAPASEVMLNELPASPRTPGGTLLPGSVPGGIEVIGDFEIISKLGQGGMGAVYRARQRSLDRVVALKILPGQMAADVLRFQREARLAASVVHPNLVRVYTSGEAAGLHYIAMELVEGDTLSDRLKLAQQMGLGGLPAAEALRITLAVARALECGWLTCQLIHRDIKPGNIFLTAQGDVKLGDLGLAKALGGDSTGLTQTGSMMGTPLYISPEQARGDREIDFRADIYSLGCTLFHMLTGRVPYEGRDPLTVLNQHLSAPPPAILKVMPQLPIPLARLVARMLKKIWRERHASYEELIAEIERVQAAIAPPAVAIESPLPAVPAPPPALQPPPRKSKVPLYGAVLAVLVLSASFAVWLGSARAPRAGAGAPAGTSTPSGAAALPERVGAARVGGESSAGAPKTTREARALPDATQDATFVNSLGMKFVPVPIGGGPTKGQRVFFSVWDTRVADYAAYAKAREAAGKNVDSTWKTQERDGVPVGRELDHPVVGVSWEDAQAFCQWLTTKEQAEGKLPQGVKYRLPSDEEWSWAVGMPPEVNATPEEKHGKNSVDFPWGKEYPPTKKVGNYGDETFRAKFPEDPGNKEKDQPRMTGYTDGYATTSPVGSFPANADGLYDMGGNVWQWCEDWWNKEQKERVLRGASWILYGRAGLLSSIRLHSTPGNRANNRGFRVVVAGVSAP